MHGKKYQKLLDESARSKVIVDYFRCVRGVLRLYCVGNAGACCPSHEKSTSKDCIKAVAVILVAAVVFYTECYLRNGHATFMKIVKTRYQNGKFPKLDSAVMVVLSRRPCLQSSNILLPPSHKFEPTLY
ncbi:uncharacterized protein [Triticum aestivum]|uniref:uncharacterized protein n=1 Tax=Triticum aestivum TaxID=4565 RepID=UPI001D02FE04|nr:uncharacterized protein LOC123164268 [Triticum aestivum]